MSVYPVTDVDDEDNEKREMNESDVAGLHRFFSKHLELPDHKDLLTLFSQVLHTHIHIYWDMDTILYTTTIEVQTFSFNLRVFTSKSGVRCRHYNTFYTSSPLYKGPKVIGQ